MKFNPNTMQTKEDAQLALIDQGYENIDTHPVLNKYDEETGLLIEEQPQTPVEDFVVPQEVTAQADEETSPNADSLDRVRRVAKLALDTTSEQANISPYTIDHRGNVLTAEEVKALQDPDTHREPANRY